MLSNSLSFPPNINAPIPAFLQGSALEKQAGQSSNATLPETLRPVDKINKSQLQKGKDLDNKEEAKKLSVKEEKSAKNPNKKLAIEEQAEVKELQQRDTEVRSHEQAHLSAAGGIATSAASFTYTKGPDGQRYATGGEVSIDTSAIAGDPAATAAKAEQIKRAALAPTNPSAQDLSVASSATTMKSQAQADLLKLLQESADPEKSKPELGQIIDQVA